MNEARRERVRELIQALEAAQERLQAILIDEEQAFGDRSQSSKETESGGVSQAALDHLDDARDGIQDAIEHMQYAIGDDSLPAPLLHRSTAGHRTTPIITTMRAAPRGGPFHFAACHFR